MVENYVNKEVCDIQMTHLNATMDETRKSMKEINVKLDNHMVHMAADISAIKTVLETMNERNSGTIGFKMVTVITGVTLALIGVITSLIGKIR